MTREFIIAARRPAVPVAACLVGVLLSAFTIVWAPGVPVFAPLDLYVQTRTLHWILLAVALPWTAVRCSAGERADAFVRLAGMTGLRPARVVLVKVIALGTVLVLVAFTGIPALVVAQQSAAVPASTVMLDSMSLVGLAALVAAATTTAMLLVRGPLAQWLTSTAGSAGLLLAISRPVSDFVAMSAIAALTATAVVLWVQAWSNRRLLYLRGSLAQ